MNDTPTPEATPERAPMLPELLIECRVNLGTILGIAGEDSDFGRLAWRTGQLIDRIGSGITALSETNERLHAVIAERDAEIGRYAGWLDRIMSAAISAGRDEYDGPNRANLYAIVQEMADAALAGEAVPDEH